MKCWLVSFNSLISTLHSSRIYPRLLTEVESEIRERLDQKTHIIFNHSRVILRHFFFLFPNIVHSLLTNSAYSNLSFFTDSLGWFYKIFTNFQCQPKEESERKITSCNYCKNIHTKRQEYSDIYLGMVTVMVLPSSSGLKIELSFKALMAGLVS